MFPSKIILNQKSVQTSDETIYIFRLNLRKDKIYGISSRCFKLEIFPLDIAQTPDLAISTSPIAFIKFIKAANFEEVPVISKTNESSVLSTV